MQSSVSLAEPIAVGRPSLGERLSVWLPQIVLLPSLLATFLYVFVFSVWTFYISLSDSSLLPSYNFVGFEHYAALWSNRRWHIAYTNLFLFGVLYVIGAMFVGLLLAILIDQRVRGEAIWRTIYLYPLAVSFVVTGTVWSWLLNPGIGIQKLVHDLGWTTFRFDWLIDRDMAIWTIVIAAIWQSSGFAMALFLAGLRSVDSDIIKAAQIDGAGPVRTYWRVILPTLWPITITVVVVQLQFAISAFDLVRALTNGGPGIATQLPALVVYDLMFQRSQLGRGAAAAVLMLLILLAVLLPYAAWRYVQRRQATHA